MISHYKDKIICLYNENPNTLSSCWWTDHSLNKWLGKSANLLISWHIWSHIISHKPPAWYNMSIRRHVSDNSNWQAILMTSYLVASASQQQNKHWLDNICLCRKYWPFLFIYIWLNWHAFLVIQVSELVIKFNAFLGIRGGYGKCQLVYSSMNNSPILK